MFTKILKFKFVLIVGLVFFMSCTKKFVQINTNPATYSQSNFDPNFLLTNAEMSYAESYSMAPNFIYNSTIIQGFSSVLDYWAGDKYLLFEAYTSYWVYGSQVKTIVELLHFTKDKPQYKNLYQIARILKALIMERITDMHGDVPYTEAGLGYYDKILFPVYDKQQDIYTDLMNEVDEATIALDEAGDIPGGDVLYNGSIKQWKKFGNTLLLRIAMRLTKVNPKLAQTYVTKVLGKTMESNADNAFVMGDASGGTTTSNNYSLVLLGDQGNEHYYCKWSQTFINILKSKNDPRLAKVAVTELYLDPNSKVQNPLYKSDPILQKGMPNGKDLSGIPGLSIKLDPSFTSFPDYSSPNPYMIKRDGPSFILTYAESELLLAEAAQRWGIGGSADIHYNNGVRAAMTYLSQYDPALAISDEDVSSYLSTNPYETTNGLEMINSQFWICANTMFDFYESWSNWRRTGFPVLTPVNYPNNVTDGTIPRRLPYPTSEANNNPVNYQVASDAVPGGDNLMGRVWWDIK